MMKNHICKKWPFLAFTVFFFFLSSVGILQGQPQLFSDDFSTNNNVNYVTSGVLGSSSWTAYRSAVDWGVRINTIPAQLEISNDISASANQIGWAYANASFSASCFSNTLSSNLGQVIWTFNMRQSDLNPEGFSSGDNGLAFILAGSNVNVNNTGNGYAVVLGQSGTTDAIRLVSYTNGLSGTLNNLIISNTAGVTDISSEYISVKVVYTPATNLWELFLRNDGASFVNPNTGLLTSQGTVVNNTYTSVSLGQTGAYYQGGTIAQNAFFDNVGVQVLLSVPTSSGTTINCGQTATLSASGSPLSYAWYGWRLTSRPRAILKSRPVSTISHAGWHWPPTNSCTRARSFFRCSSQTSPNAKTTKKKFANSTRISNSACRSAPAISRSGVRRSSKWFCPPHMNCKRSTIPTR